MPTERSSPATQALRTSQLALMQAITGGELAPGVLRDDPRTLRGLAVYRHAYLARLREALADNYPVFARALGDDRFAALADSYAQACPPHAAHLRPYGDSLVGFLEGTHGTADQLPHPAFLDLARLDWALRQAFDALDGETLTAAQLQTLHPEDWPALPLQLIPGASLVQLEWAVEPIWHALNGASAEAEPELAEPGPHPHAVLVWRTGLENRWRTLLPGESVLISSLAGGTRLDLLGEALAATLEDPDEAPPMLLGYLQQWLSDGCLRSCLPAGDRA